MASAVIDTAVAGDRPRGSAAPELERREILRALRLLRRGDFSVRLPLDLAGIDGEIACAFNEVVELNDAMTRDFERVSEMVGREGMISERVHVHGATGSWAHCVDSINRLVGDMSYPVSEVARVIGAVARGNLSQSMNPEVDGRPVRGEYLRISGVVNTMVDQLASFASEVTRVAREVGTEGKLGGQAHVRRRGGHLEGSHRLRESHGREPHRPGAQHRRSHDRGGERQSVEEDHGRRQGRNSRAEEHHQHDGGPAQHASPPR